MMHENNCKAIQDWTKSNYANAYRDWFNNWLDVEHWFSSFMPEPETMETAVEFRAICKHFHEMGF